MFFPMAIWLIPVLIIILFVLVVAGNKLQSKTGGGEDMIKKVYIYLVLFATLMMTIGGSVTAFMAIADIIAPALPYHQSFEDFRRGMVRPYYEAEREAVTEGGDMSLSEKELRERYETMLRQQRDNQIERAKNSLLKSLGWIVVPLPVFILFQRRLAGEERNKNLPVEGSG